jgi:pyruvate dehydrogenase E1 component alpha subunit
LVEPMLQITPPGCEPSPAEGKGRRPVVELLPEQLQELHRTMVRTRVLEERGTALQRQGRIGFYIGCMGQEASHIGATYALRPDDWIFPAYREPGAALLRGISPKSLFDQCFGNADDVTRGRQMPCHYTFKDIHFATVSSPIGTQIPQATGAAMAMRIRKKDTVAITFFGDGATSSNDFHAGLNFAGVYQAPVIFFCQNNQWAISLPVERQTAAETLAAKAAGYGMPGIRVDGNDVLAVFQATREAAERARAGHGPTLIEALTYRVGPHSTSDDPRRYRPDSLTDSWKERDPIERFRQYMEETIGWTREQDERVWQAARDEMLAALQASERVPPPALNSLVEDVYAETPWHLREERDEAIRAHASPPATGDSDDYKFP